MTYYNPQLTTKSHSTAQWTGHPSSATQASLSQSVETKQSPQQEQTQQPATNAPVGQCVPEVTTPASHPLSRANSGKSASEKLQDQLTEMVLSEADKHFLDNRICRNSKHAIRIGILEILGRYVISEAAEE